MIKAKPYFDVARLQAEIDGPAEEPEEEATEATPEETSEAPAEAETAVSFDYRNHRAIEANYQTLLFKP